jgi:hypothetical protein
MKIVYVEQSNHNHFEMIYTVSGTRRSIEIYKAVSHTCKTCVICERSRINILQWILTNLGTYLDIKRIWKPIDFQGQRSRSQGYIIHYSLLIINLYIGQNPLKDLDSRVFTRCYAVNIWPGDLENQYGSRLS